MVTIDDVRQAALRLPATTERSAPRGGHPQFVTNGKCFAELPPGLGLRIWTAGSWSAVDPSGLEPADLEARLLSAWRLRARKRDVAELDYARGREELADLFATLRTWPELVERGVGDFHAGGRAFLHFHHSEHARHADVKDGLGWGAPVAFPLGPPPPDVVDRFLAEARRRLDTTMAALGR